MKFRLSTDLATGILFLALGGFAIVYGSQYDYGSASRMGPGYFPALAAGGLVILGLVLAARSFFVAGEEVATIAVRPLALVLAGTVGFGLLIEDWGLAVAGTLLVFAARLADQGFRPVEVAVLAVCLIAITGGIFSYGLGLPIHLWPR